MTMLIQVVEPPPRKNPDEVFDPIRELERHRLYHDCGCGHIDYFEGPGFFCTGCEADRQISRGQLRITLRRFFITHEDQSATAKKNGDACESSLRFSFIKEPPY